MISGDYLLKNTFMTNSSSDEDAVSTPDAALNELSSNLDPTPPIETKGKSCESSSESTESDGDDSDEVAPVIPSLREIGIAEAPEWDDGLPDFAKQDIGTPLIRRLCAFGPIVALSIIFFISAAAVYLHTMWWPLVSIDGVAHLAVFMAWIYATLNNFLLSVRVGGGYVPRRWNPPADSTPDFSQRLQWCKICEGFKPPRSHHCSKCGRCVMKMDHHCLWINNCVGHRNHCFFVRFLLSAILGCAHATIILGHSLYHAINIGWYIRYGDGTEPIVELSFTSFLVCVSAIALAMGVTVALSILLFVQAKCIKKNMTGVEEYICEKAKARMREERHRGANFIFPYDIGWRRNIKEVMSSFSGKQCGTGIWWPIRQDCTQFSFSEEQLRQKKLKRQHARFVNITKSCKGGLCGAFSVSIKAFICQPLSDESRLAVVEGEKWIVTGGNKHWLYGFCEGTNRKGWFPRQCAELLDERPHLD